MRAAHPIHVHAVGFLVLDRRPFNRTHFAATDGNLLFLSIKYYFIVII